MSEETKKTPARVIVSVKSRCDWYKYNLNYTGLLEAQKLLTQFRDPPPLAEVIRKAVNEWLDETLPKLREERKGRGGDV